MKSEKTVTIIKTTREKNLWGYVVNPEELQLLYETDLMVIKSKYNITQLNRLKKESGFNSLNDFIMDSIKKGIVELVEPAYENTIIGSFLFKEQPKLVWAIDAEKLYSGRLIQGQSYYVYKSNGENRFVCTTECYKSSCTYNPVSENKDGDLVWYQSHKDKKLVMKQVDGAILANIMFDSDFEKLLAGKS